MAELPVLIYCQRNRIAIARATRCEYDIRGGPVFTKLKQLTPSIGNLTQTFQVLLINGRRTLFNGDSTLRLVNHTDLPTLHQLPQLQITLRAVVNSKDTVSMPSAN